ncbi:hypothetical protein [Arthrobacter sp. lap29]|uniref:hypothetical protein n=1 Tax=Arthrobacter sp. lap29 TaxID=3056122 RepID=UPI0028F6C75B|nr:hypothetical protein [Arthrobacter sp. lap29]
MTKRSQQAATSAQQQGGECLRFVASTQSPADQISAVKSLFNARTITGSEYAQLKAKAFA